MSNELITYKDMDDNEINLNITELRNTLFTKEQNSLITEQEIKLYVKMCQHQKLNPYLKEIYLIKYKAGAPASFVTGIDTFRKRATLNSKYRGCSVTTDGTVVRGADGRVDISKTDLTATAKVFVDGYVEPVTVTVDFNEYVGKTIYNGKIMANAQWNDKPKTMLKKVAEAQAKRQAFPLDLSNLYTSEEIAEPVKEAETIKPAELVTDIDLNKIKDKPKQSKPTKPVVTEPEPVAEEVEAEIETEPETVEIDFSIGKVAPEPIPNNEDGIAIDVAKVWLDKDGYTSTDLVARRQFLRMVASTDYSIPINESNDPIQKKLYGAKIKEMIKSWSDDTSRDKHNGYLTAFNMMKDELI